MKKLLTLFLIFAALTPVFSQKNYTSEKVVVLPQEFFVGDLVEMRVVIRPERGVSVQKPERFPDSYWVRIENADVFELEDGRYELRVFLRPYAPGIRTLPAIQFGDVLLRDIRIQTGSVLTEDPPPFAPPAEQIVLPGTKYYIALFVGLIFLIPVFFIFFWTTLRRRVTGYIAERKRRRPYRRLVRALNELEGSLESGDVRLFYIELIEILRAYLTARGSIDYSSATVRESSVMIISDFKGLTAAEELIKLFILADEIKFGGRQVESSQCSSDLHHVRTAAEEIEEASGGQTDVDL